MTTKKHIHDDDDGTKQESDETPPRTRRRRRGHEQAPWLLESKTLKLPQKSPRGGPGEGGPEARRNEREGNPPGGGEEKSNPPLIRSQQRIPRKIRPKPRTVGTLDYSKPEDGTGYG